MGALEEMDYVKKLAAAGFDGIDIEPTRIYNIEDARQFLAGEGLDVDAVAPLVENKFMSAFVRARNSLISGTPFRPGICASIRITAGTHPPPSSNSSDASPLAAVCIR